MLNIHHRPLPFLLHLQFILLEQVTHIYSPEFLLSSAQPTEIWLSKDPSAAGMVLAVSALALLGSLSSRHFSVLLHDLISL